jgi:hypothetical protein
LQIDPAVGVGVAIAVLIVVAVVMLFGGGGPSLDEIEAKVVDLRGDMAAACIDGGDDSLGSTVYRCQVTLRGGPTTPELEGAKLEKCYKLISGDVFEVSCSRLSPANGGKPKRP